MIIFLFVIIIEIQSLYTQAICTAYADMDIDYYGEKFLCKQKINGCRICQSGECKNCLEGFYLNSNTQCQSCKDVFGKSVATCELNNGKLSIVKCAKGFYKDPTTGSCLQCGQDCIQCSDSYTCTECQSDKLLFQYQCISCQQTSLQNCCFEQLNTCKTCIQSYYKDNSNQCVKCMNNCKKCQQASICDECQEGYYFDQNQRQCVSNPLNCKEACITENLRQLKCINCMSGTSLNSNKYYLDTQGVCIICTLQNCKVCGNQTQCQECEDGYTLMSFYVNKVLHQECYNCQTNCSRCQMQGTNKICYECADKKNPVNGSCLSQLKFQWDIIQSQNSSILKTLNAVLLILLFEIFI